MIIYTRTITKRLRYISDLIGRETYGKAFHLTVNIDEFRSFEGPKINYSEEKVSDKELWIQPHPLLFEIDIRPQAVGLLTISGLDCFFKTGGDLGFDIFAASFYLVSRYEEYLPHQNDIYGRYAHENSLAFQKGFLDQPMVNKWIHLLQDKLRVEQDPAKNFKFIPTYDIDEAWSYKNKSWVRSAGGALKDLLRGNFTRFNERRRVLNGKLRDPYDSYAWLDEMHQSSPSFHPRYFFHVASKNGRYDKNNLPSERSMQELIRRHADKYEIGLHPSWQSGDDHSLLITELATLEKIAARKITASRQHFIRFTLPQTYQRLIAAGIREDYSMGYGSINGFRASIASPFYWYDLEKEESTSLLLFPFCFMEANSFYEQKFNPSRALKEMVHYHDEIKKVNGTMITIWHNTFLGTEGRFEGWREAYSEFSQICRAES